jgi:peptidoglycan/LPS O-acetylase OafA/YrhL
LKNLFAAFLRPGVFRLFLAVLVVVDHTTRYDLGAWAVYSFFILSGYWIYRMWTQKYSRAASPLAVFYSSRAWRIVPMFWLANAIACAFFITVAPTFFESASPHWPMLPAVLSNVFLFGYAELPLIQKALDVAWSLDVELQFYLLFPLLVPLCNHPRLGKLFFSLLGSVLGAGFILMLMTVHMADRTLFSCGIFFTVGTLAARFDWKPNLTTALLGIGLVAVYCAVCLRTPAWYHLIARTPQGMLPEENHQKQSFQAVLALLTAPLVLFTVRRASSAFDRHLGEYTFALYLFHWPVVIFYRYYYGQLRGMARLPSLSVAWLAIAVLSLGAYWLFDRPVERWRRRWVAGRMAS